MTHEQKEANKKFDPPARDAEAFDAAMRAIEECRAKPSYDYQRVIICHTISPDLGPKLARRSGAALAGPALPLDSKRALDVILIEKAGDCSLETLESIVFFVNRTRGVVVLTDTGQSFVRWQERWPIPAAQIRRRTHMTIEFDR